MQSISQELSYEPKEHICDGFYISINYFQTHLHRIITKRKETKRESNANMCGTLFFSSLLCKLLQK